MVFMLIMFYSMRINILCAFRSSPQLRIVGLRNWSEGPLEGPTTSLIGLAWPRMFSYMDFADTSMRE